MRAGRVAVIGAGLGGLSAAGTLARAGCDVTLFESAPHLGGKASTLSAEGVTLDTGPTLLTLPGLVRQTFEALGASDLLPPLVELPQPCAYHWRDGQRFDVHRDLERTAASAAELHPREREGVLRFYAEAHEIHRAAGEPYLEAPFEGIADFMARAARRGVGAVALGMRLGTLHELACKHFRTEHLRQFVGRFATYAGASPYEASAAFALICHLERVEGVHHVRGGIGAMARALGEAVTRLGVRVLPGARARWEREGDAFRIQGGEIDAPFDAVIVNADPIACRGAGGPLALSGYVLLLSVAERLALPHHTVLFSSDYPREFQQLFGGRIPEDPTVYLCHPVATDPSMAAPGRSGVFIMVNAPLLTREDEEHPEAWGARAARLRALCLERLDRLAPGAAAKATIIGERTPWDLARLGAPRGSIYGFLPHGRLGPFQRPRMRGRAPGFFFAGGGTHPGGGVPLVMLSGRFAAQMALEHLRGGGR